MQAHGVGRCLVQDQGEGIELHHLMEPAGQLMEQRGQIAVRDDRFRNGQQGSVPVASGSCLSVEVSRLSWRKPWSVTNPEPSGGQPPPGVEVACTTHILSLFRIANITSDHRVGVCTHRGATPANRSFSESPAPVRGPPNFPGIRRPILPCQKFATRRSRDAK